MGWFKDWCFAWRCNLLYLCGLFSVKSAHSLRRQVFEKGHTRAIRRLWWTRSEMLLLEVLGMGIVITIIMSCGRRPTCIVRMWPVVGMVGFNLFLVYQIGTSVLIMKIVALRCCWRSPICWFNETNELIDRNIGMYCNTFLYFYIFNIYLIYFYISSYLIYI